MRSKKEIQAVIHTILSDTKTPLFGMTYEAGVEEALNWVLEELDNDEFYYTEITNINKGNQNE